MNDRFGHDTYQVHRKFFQLLGAKISIFDPAGNLALFAHMKAFKLKEDIRLYTDEAMQNEILSIRARSVIDFAAAYDVYLTHTGEKVGALKRKGLKSIFKDEWIIMDYEDREIGLISEDSTAMALVRRFLTNLIPQSFNVEVGGAVVATCKQNFNPFVQKMTLDFNPQTEFDRRLGLAAAVLLVTVEGKQQ